MTLYELASEYQEVLNMIEAGDVDEQVIADTLESIGGEIEDKADAYAKMIAVLNADVDALKKEADRLTARKKAIEANIDRMKASLENAMRATGKTKFKTQFFSFNIQKNPVSLFIADMDMVPGRFMVPQPDLPDKAAIKEYLKENGNQSWAQLQQGESLRIK